MIPYILLKTEEKMKLLIVSDIHGSAYYAEKIQEIEKREKPDTIIVLGDIYYYRPKKPETENYAPLAVADILNAYKEKIIATKGNCDTQIDEKLSKFPMHPYAEMEVDGLKLFFTHGHTYNMQKLPPKEFDILFYGHLHKSFIQEKEGKLFVNPGSITLPKKGYAHSYAIYENKEIFIKEINGNILETYQK